MKQIADTMEKIRNNPPKVISGVDVAVFKDIEKGVLTYIKSNKTESTGLPKSNVLCFYLEDGSSLIVRPSGTEPKIKLYICAVGKDNKSGEEMLGKLLSDGTKLLGF